MSNTPNLAASNSDVVELKSQVSGLQSQVQNLAGMIQQLVGATTIQTNGAVPNLAGNPKQRSSGLEYGAETFNN
ncbi:unnamed protein product [Brassica oleracea]